MLAKLLSVVVNKCIAITGTTEVDQTNLCVDRLYNVESSFNGDDDNRPRGQMREVVGESVR